jgi:HK97 family phage prohead protease
MFVPGAFKRSIDTAVTAGKVKFLDAHPYKYPGIPSTKYVMGKVIAAFETETELVVRIYVSKTKDGDDLLTKIQDGTIDAISVGYIVVRHRFEKIDGEVIRILEEVKLMEVSAVIWGMHDRAKIDALSVKEDEIDTVKALTFQATLSEELATDDLWKLNCTFNETLRDILGDESVEDKMPLLTKALDDYKSALARLLGLDSAELTGVEGFVTIRANEPLAALLKIKALGEKEEEIPPLTPDPPKEEEPAPVSDEAVQALKNRLNKVRLGNL